MKWAAFDLEFTKLLPGLDEEISDDLHISCASIITTGSAWPQVWYERPVHGGEMPNDYMSVKTLEAFLDSLYELVQNGHLLVTWGGSSSDWKLLAKEVPHRALDIVNMALQSVDVPMCTCMSIGMMMGLNAACKALGFSLKDDTSSENIPDLWNQKTLEARLKVLQHVSNDAFATMLVVKNAENSGQLAWISLKGHYKTWSPVHFLTVKACLSKELPSVPFQIGPNHNAKILARWLLLPVQNQT
jgi:hypothetical protein